MLTKQQEKLLDEAVAIEKIDAKQGGGLGFMARAMVQATIPHRKPISNEFVRRNGNYTLTLIAPSEVGLPYGTIPRLLLAWISTEAVRNKSRTLFLGDTLSQFMRQLDLIPTGGKWGSITRLREQAKRLFSCHINLNYHVKGNRDSGSNLSIADDYDLWWSQSDLDQVGLWTSSIELNEKFYKEVTTRPIPIDMRALKVLKKSPLTLDVYFWLVYRLYYLQDSTLLPWGLLMYQFGSDYAVVRQFKVAFIEALNKVKVVYPEAKALPTEEGLKLMPSAPHISR